MTTEPPTCAECGDGNKTIVWVIVDGLYYPFNLNYHRHDDGTIICGSCHIVLREPENRDKTDDD